MSVNTQNTSDYDEDVNAQETETVRAAATAAENEVFLRDTLGIFLPEHIQTADIAEKVAHRVTLMVDETRNNFDRGQLQNLLNRKLQDRINAARVTPKEAGTLSTATDTQRNRNIRAVVEAIRESIPTVAMNDVLRYGSPAVIAENQNVPAHHISIDSEIGGGFYPSGTKSKVLIDTRHSFWRDNEYPGTDDLRDALRAKGSLSSVGISVVGPPPLAESYTLTNNDIDNIIAANSSVIDLSRRYDNFTQPITIAGSPVNFNINLQGLLRYRDSAGRLVASYTGSTTDLLDLLQSDDDVWNFIAMDPNVEPLPTFVYTMLVNRIYTAAGITPGSTDALALEQRSVSDLQKEVAEQHRFHTTLREGSDNQMGAAFASTILMKYKDIRSILQSVDQAKTKEKLDKENAKLRLLQAMDGLGSIDYNVAFSWDEAISRKAECTLAKGALAPGATITIGGEDYDIPTIANAALQQGAMNDARKWIQDKEKENADVEKQSIKLANKLRPITQSIHSILGGAYGSPPAILNLFSATGVAVESEFTTSISISTLVQEVKDLSGLELTDVDEHKTKADGFKAELEKLEKGEMPKGAEAQHLVIKEYLIRYHGMTPSEASSASNVVRGRSLIDTEMSRAIEEISGDIHGDVDEDIARAEERGEGSNKAGRDLKRIAEVAKASRIPVGSNNVPNWSGGSYKNLMGAYFALRQMNDGTDVPWMMRLSGSNVARRQLREITRAILKTHAKAMLQEFGSSVGISDDKQKEILKDPTKPEHQAILTQILEGEVPENQKAQVKKILGTADKKLFRIRRGIGYAAGSMLYGDKNPVSGKNLLYGNKYASARGAAHGVKNVAVAGKNAVVGTAAGTWNNKGTIAKIGALTAIGGPIGLAIGLGVWGGDFGKGSNANSTLAA